MFNKKAFIERSILMKLLNFKVIKNRLYSTEKYSLFSTKMFNRNNDKVFGNILRSNLLKTTESITPTKISIFFSEENSEIYMKCKECFHLPYIKESVEEINSRFRKLDFNLKKGVKKEQVIVKADFIEKEKITGKDFKLPQYVRLVNPEKEILTPLSNRINLIVIVKLESQKEVEFSSIKRVNFIEREELLIEVNTKNNNTPFKALNDSIKNLRTTILEI